MNQAHSLSLFGKTTRPNNLVNLEFSRGEKFYFIKLRIKAEAFPLHWQIIDSVIVNAHKHTLYFISGKRY